MIGDTSGSADSSQAKKMDLRGSKLAQATVGQVFRALAQYRMAKLALFQPQETGVFD